jgi:hypothetical protein
MFIFDNGNVNISTNHVGGDNSGLVHVRASQALVVTEPSPSLGSSMLVHQNGSATFSGGLLTIPPVSIFIIFKRAKKERRGGTVQLKENDKKRTEQKEI